MEPVGGLTTTELLGNTVVSLLDTLGARSNLGQFLLSKLRIQQRSRLTRRMSLARLACSATVLSVSHLVLAFIAQRSLCRPSCSSQAGARDEQRKGDDVLVIPAEPRKFQLARADQLSLGQPISLYMLWYCVLMCRIQIGDEVPYRLPDGDVITVPKLGGSGPDCMRFINLLDFTGKLLFGCWHPYLLDPYWHWQLGFTVGRVVSDCLAIRCVDWERAYGAGWCISEQFWDVMKAF